MKGFQRRARARSVVLARAFVSKCDGNASARRFWLKLEKLHELDVGLPFDVLEGELKHFRKEIPMRI